MTVYNINFANWKSGIPVPAEFNDNVTFTEWSMGQPATGEPVAAPAFVPYPYPRGLRGGVHVLSGGLS